MPKGYWIGQVDVADTDAYARYVEASRPAFAEFGAVSLARGGRTHVLEGGGRPRVVVWEFPSFEAAIACYESPRYQLARQ